MALWRWVLLGLIRSPLLGGLWIVLLIWVPLVVELQALPSSQSALDVAVLCFFPAALVATAASQEHLSRSSEFLARLPPGMRFAGEAGALALAALYLQLPILLGALGAGASALDIGSALPDILTADLRLAGTSLVLLSLPLSSRARFASLLLATWILPALSAYAPRILRVLVTPIDAGLSLRADGHPAVVPALAAALALWSAAYLLRTRRARVELR